MKRITHTYLVLLLAIVTIPKGPCSGAPLPTTATEIVLMASTPGDPVMINMLGISNAGIIDFIRWKLTMHANKTFTADLIYGESKPNTLGFKEDYKLTITGQYTAGEVFDFESVRPSARFRLIRLNDQIYHFLTPDGKMLVGNGGWGYCLNRVFEVTPLSKVLPAPLTTAKLAKDTATHFTFDGRTPCVELAKDQQLAVRDGCFKLKWRLILNRDPKTLAPTTYILKTINHRADTVAGKWTIIHGIPGQPDAIIYQLDPDKPEAAISFLVLDENVILFLRRDYSLYVGNADFSYSLNRNYTR